MKKLISVILSVLFLASCLATAALAGHLEDGNWVPENTVWEPLEKSGDVVARFAIGADLHMGAGQYYPYAKLDYTFRALSAIGGVDMLGICGDVTDNSKPDAYAEVMELVNRNAAIPAPATGEYVFGTSEGAVGTVLLSMGNHEYLDASESHVERFERCTGQDACGLYWINGVPIIKISPADEQDSGNYKSKAIEDFIVDSFKQIDDSGYTGIIIGMAHHRIPTGTKTESTSNWTENELKLFAEHPNFIMFTGHSHTFYYNMSEFIDQDRGFTHIRAGVMGHFWGGSNDPINPETGRTGDPLTGNCENSCALVLVDVMKNGTAVLRRIDISKGEYVFGDQPIVVDPKGLIYKTSSGAGTYAENVAAPSFPDGAELTVTYEDNHDTIVVHFPSASSASDKAYDYIWRYRIRLIETENEDEKMTFYVLNDSQLTEQRPEWSVPVPGLKPDTDYTVKVIAMTGYGKNSSALTAGPVNVGHVEAKYPAEPILEVDASKNSIDETYGREIIEQPVRLRITDAADIGRKAIQLQGFGPIGYSFNKEDYEKIRFGFTYEAYFKAQSTEQAQFVMGSADSASSGLRIEGGKLYLWGNFRSINNASMKERLIASAPIEDGKWYHAVATYDGLEVRLYLNGEFVDSGQVTGGLDQPAFDEASEFFIGDFAPLSGTVRYPFSGSVNLVRVYEGTMNADDVKEAYEAAISKRAYEIFNDVPADAYYEPAVTWAVRNGVTSGTSATTFSPEDGCTRGQVVTFLWRAAGSPEPANAKNPFSDVKNGEYYYKAVLWAVEKGVTKGTSATKFSPDDTCTRGQIVTFLYRSEGSPAPTSSANPFGDVKDGDYFKDAVLWAVEKGITLGTTAKTFSPSDTCTRGQVVTFLYRNAG
ncbi:MAG: S-layer homology domain-containing protein [Clostridia bacterium]|nr:S-layer homology domain-containing protein [Clostridia bacterium]